MDFFRGSNVVTSKAFVLGLANMSETWALGPHACELA